MFGPLPQPLSKGEGSYTLADKIYFYIILH